MHAPLEVGRDRDAPAMQALLREKVALCRQRLEHGGDAGMQPRRHVLGVAVQQLQGLPTTELRVGLPRCIIHQIPIHSSTISFSRFLFHDFFFTISFSRFLFVPA
jgi:hypothetical protein